MGLPVWRDPDEVKIKKEREGTIKPDPTAAGRSPIRRRSLHPTRRRSSYYPSRQPFPPRIERSPPPSVGFNGLRNARRGEHRGVPPVFTLLESAATGAPESREESILSRAVGHSAAARHPRSTWSTTGVIAGPDDSEQPLNGLVVPGDWEEWTEADRESWLEDNDIPRYLYARASEGYGSTTPRATESMLRSRGSQDESQGATLPTPPSDESRTQPRPHESGNEVSRQRISARRHQHPLSRSWRADSPVNGLGDRNRSPTPADNWDLMHQTIAPDTTLPSADSSFTSAAASSSFASNNSASTSITAPDFPLSSNISRRNSDEEDSVSSVDPDDLVCDDEELAATAAFAEHVFREERGTPEGRARISRHTQALAGDQNRYALSNEHWRVEIGFRLIDEALDTLEGRVRVFELTQSLPADVRNNFEDWIFTARRSNSSQQPERRRTRGNDDDAQSPSAENHPSSTLDAVREASEQVHGFFRRFTAEDTLTSSQREMLRSARTSPPPRYEPPEVTISNDEPEPHPVASISTSRPVSPPSARSERDVGDALLSGDEQDLSAIRRVVERLAQRDDVPEGWWMSMGLNLSRTRARSRSRSRSTTPLAPINPSSRVRVGRVERDRTGSRL